MEFRSIRTSLSNEGNGLKGYAAKFNTPSHLLTERGRTFVEVIQPGAFRKSLEKYPVTAHWTHDERARPPLGRTPNTLKLAEDATGLRFDLPELPVFAADVRESVNRGDVGGMSFKFSNAVDKWEQRGGVTYRTISEMRLHHIAIVMDPAYPETSVAVRGIEPPESLSVIEAELMLRLRKL